MKTMNRMFITAVVTVALALTSPAGAQSSSVSAAQTVKTPAERAKEITDWLLAEQWESVFQTFTPEMQKGLPLDVLKNQVGPSLKKLGNVQSIGVPALKRLGAYTVAVVLVTFEKMGVNIQISLEDAGKVTGLGFRPAEAAAWQRPAYSKPETFSEREVTVGEGEWKLPGTLTLPQVEGPVAGAVLVHGSGPHDRDETISANKPFKDLAEGLASKGVAVLRYEKRTQIYPSKLAGNKNITVQEETIEDAVKAAALLRTLPEINARRVFILGHSLGGYLMPRILKQDPKAAGGIVMAANTSPLEDLILEQMEYLASLQDSKSPETQKRVEQMRKLAAAMKAIQPGKEDAPPVLGMPAHYILDLRGYDSAVEAAKLSVPMLILQGERDYQVTMKDFAGWRTALGGRKDVTFKTYPALNHLFEAGEGKSAPAEYDKLGHVAAEVVDDIVKWIQAH